MANIQEVLNDVYDPDTGTLKTSGGGGGGDVASVNGQTGVVVLDAGDVGAPALQTMTDNAVLRANGTTGEYQDSLGVTIDDNGIFYPSNGVLLVDDRTLEFGNNSDVVMVYDTADADAHGFKVGLPDTTGDNTGYFMIGEQSEIIGQDIGLQTGDSYVFIAKEKSTSVFAGFGPISSIVSLVGVGTKAMQFVNPASGPVFGIASDGTNTTFTPEGGTEFAVSGILNATNGGVRGKHSTANVTTPIPTDAELDSAFGTPATVGAGFTATLDDNGAGTAMYAVASDGTNWWYTLMTKAT